MERYSAFRDDRDYEAEVDYRRKRGLLEEINRTGVEAEMEATDLRAAEATFGRDLNGPVDIDTAPQPSPPPGPPRSKVAPQNPLPPQTGRNGATGAPPAQEQPAPEQQ